MPGAQCTLSLVCAWSWVDAHEYSQRVHRDSPAFPHAMVLTAYFVLSPAIGCFATVVSRIYGRVQPGWAEPASARLDASIEASGPHDFTVRVSAVVLRA
jgi:hypothetical protein